MTDSERTSVVGKIAEDYEKAKHELTLFQHQASEEADALSELAELLRKGPPYPILPSISVDSLRLQILFKNLHDAYESKTTLQGKMQELGLL
jgi:hypothetical protein